MSQKNNIRNCLVVSYGPVPTPHHQTVEGGGMRAWGLAKGLQQNGLDVTVGINIAFPQELHQQDDIKLINWSADEQFADLINSYDAVIVSYCMGSDSVFIAENINNDVLLVLDVYVPIYVEVSARNAQDVSSELRNYLADVHRFNHVLKRGDYFICANQTQKVFYTGVLGSLGVINPRSYSQDRILVLPFGIHNEPVVAKKNPYVKLGIKNTDKIVLWFGGLYPWFRIQEYLDAVLTLSKNHTDMKFVFVGGKNPFNNNPDLLRQYNQAVAFFEKHELTDKSVFFVDWVDFDERANWYKHADFVISLNQPGEENGFSWRTRVMDYVWGELVTLTNGGDPLGDHLIAKGAAIKLDSLASNDIVLTIESIFREPLLLQKTQHNLLSLKEQYLWNNVTKRLSEKIIERSLVYKDELEFKRKHAIETDSSLLIGSSIATPVNKLNRIAKLPFRAIRHARQKGVKRSIRLAGGMVRNQLKRRALPKVKEYIFISHPIDNSGAPLILLQMIDEFKEMFGSKNIRVLAPSVTPNNARSLAGKGIRVQKSAVMSPRMTGAQLGIKKNDFILINTAAIYDNYRNYVFNLLDAGRLKHAYWFIHEDTEQLKIVGPRLIEKSERRHISQLINSDKLTVLVPSRRIKKDYDELFNTTAVKVIPLRVDMEKKYKKTRPPSAYSEVNFLISGTPSDGRKGQLIAISAFHEFLATHYSNNPKLYRNFTLHLVSIGDDYISQQIKTIGSSVLGKRLFIYPSLPRHEALDVTAKCNAVICCSLNETFALYVAEGMMMGHIVLRNGSAGIDEQLQEGLNGYYIDDHDVKQFADRIERLLNKKNMADKDLAGMGKASQNIVEIYESSTYIDKILKS